MEWIHYGRYLHERMQGKPTQYITERQEFYGREFPRHAGCADSRARKPSTWWKPRSRSRRGAGRVLDVGTGSGAIAVTLRLETRRGSWATDISPAALR